VINVARTCAPLPEEESPQDSKDGVGASEGPTASSVGTRRKVSHVGALNRKASWAKAHWAKKNSKSGGARSAEIGPAHDESS
jgi:hypothetical protein